MRRLPATLAFTAVLLAGACDRADHECGLRKREFFEAKDAWTSARELATDQNGPGGSEVTVDERNTIAELRTALEEPQRALFDRGCVTA